MTETPTIVALPIERIRPNAFNPRRATKADVEALAESLSQRQLHPIVVRPVGQGFEIVAGERRWSAAKHLHWQTILATVVEMTDREAIDACIAENAQRQDLNPIEKARAIALITSQGYSDRQVAQRCGLASGSTVANYRLLLELPQSWQSEIASGAIPPSHCRCLMTMRHDHAMLSRLLHAYKKRVANEGEWTMREFDEFAHRIAIESRPAEPQAAPRPGRPRLREPDRQRQEVQPSVKDAIRRAKAILESLSEKIAQTPARLNLRGAVSELNDIIDQLAKQR
ncbi:MAG: ParB/RepB/Spo0J family partition protein [Planctomycetaceae bacterium]